MAICIFSISIMFFKARKVFLEVKLTIIDKKSSLHIETIEALKWLKSYFRVEKFIQNNLSKVLDQLQEALLVVSSLIFTFCSGFNQFLASTAKRSAFIYQTIS